MPAVGIRMDQRFIIFLNKGVLGWHQPLIFSSLWKEDVSYWPIQVSHSNLLGANSDFPGVFDYIFYLL